ncbi:50S ribosomal protein L16 [Rhodovibrio sodomensis]|jgi:large subunit ribosomal protein L16|uniref:Large ribosomal subunit protein uL16 n=1 Tax=Rhodovibrio sodomensis TaxID=1088 RepID=A0ABS1D8W7_9PROT|nr:50S ribosomal protein L16 [Rhodovibrio sodomensis]MBK1666856.1 50S ribosomal protein L16 [Rhodovibrio sodomensis]
MLQPNRTKYRKVQKGKTKLRGVAKGGTQLNFGRYGLKATSSARISARQIEAARRSITRHMRRVGKLWIRIFPDVPITDKPAEVRMGKGKGTVEWWAARVRPGRVIFELDGVPQEVAEEAFRLASAKLPVETKFVTRLEG